MTATEIVQELIDSMIPADYEGTYIATVADLAKALRLAKELDEKDGGRDE